ncbi:MAG: bis-aminopropyl spermidine synthase family protein [Vulcanimicrobiota bacterium]
MANVWLTQHLDARYGNTLREILLTNLSYGTRILMDTEGWERLAPFQSPAALPDDAWLQRSHQAHVLVGDEDRQPPDFILRLEASLKNELEKLEGKRPETTTDRAGLLELLGRAEDIFRQRWMPRPFTGNPLQAGHLMHEPHRLVDFMFDHTRAFLTHDLEADNQTVDLALLRQLFERPALKLRYEQQFCIPRTTQSRAERMIAALKPGARVLVLGDDDLVSLALLHQGGDFEVDVLELDEDLVAYLQAKGGDRLTVLQHNLRHGVPDSMKGAYDLVTTDPPYAAKGMRFFLECAVASMAPGPDTRLFLTTFPGLIEKPDQLFADLDELGLNILKTQEHFSRYIYNNSYRVQHVAALRHLGSPLHPTAELLGFPYLYAHFFECAHA